VYTKLWSPGADLIRHKYRARGAKKSPVFFVLALALGMNVGVAVFITSGAVIIIRFVFNLDL
jgi:hypothetical protein